MRVITLNLNGIRSATRKGFFTWVAEQQADIICVQETRAHLQHHVASEFKLPGYYCYFHDAITKKGYSGVGIYTRHSPLKISLDLGWPTADREGRYIQLDFPKISFASLYMPSGRSGEHRQKIKFAFLDQYLPILEKIKQNHKQHDFIICGDWNIAHKEIDLKNWRTNQKHSGFLPEERAWLDKVFGKVGLIDAFRVINKEANQYTWWSNFGHAWENNVGWRIDYQVVTPNLKNKITTAHIYKEQRFSDHAPLIMDYEYELEHSEEQA